MIEIFTQVAIWFGILAAIDAVVVILLDIRSRKRR
jgi:hypothetical protein